MEGAKQYLKKELAIGVKEYWLEDDWRKVFWYEGTLVQRYIGANTFATKKYWHKARRYIGANTFAAKKY